MRIFVTGSTGFIGRRTVTVLQGRGHQVVALVRTYERARDLPRGIRAVPGDVTRPDSFKSALAGCDAVIHLAAAMTLGPSRVERERLTRINVDGARAVREAAAAAGVGRFVHLSHVSAYGNRGASPVREGERPDPAFADTFAGATRARAQAEAMDAAATSGAIIVVPGQAYDPATAQPADPEFALWRGERFWVVSGAQALRNWTPVDRLALGLCDVVERGTPGAVYHLAGSARTVRELADGSPAGPFKIWLPSMLPSILARALRNLWPAQAERWRARAGITRLLDTSLANAELGALTRDALS